MAITHTFVSTKSDDADTSLVRPSNWNADHTITDGTLTFDQLSAAAIAEIRGPTVIASATSQGGASSTSHSLILPGSFAKGDLLIACFADSVGSGTTVTWNKGWIQIGRMISTTDTGLSIAYRVTDGFEGSLGAAAITTSAATKNATAVYRINNCNLLLPPTVSFAIGSDATPQPPTHTSSYGVKDILWLEAGAVGINVAFTAQSTNYENFQATNSIGGVGNTNASIGAATKVTNGSSETPGTMTLASSQAWVTALVAVYPIISPRDIDYDYPTDRALDDTGGTVDSWEIVQDGVSDGIWLAPSTTTRPSLNIAAGTAPTTPADGDIWFDGAALKIQIGGLTKTVTVT